MAFFQNLIRPVAPAMPATPKVQPVQVTPVPQQLPKISAPTAAEIVPQTNPSPEAQKIPDANPQPTPSQYLNALQEKQMGTEMTKTLAHGMPATHVPVSPPPGVALNHDGWDKTQSAFTVGQRTPFDSARRPSFVTGAAALWLTRGQDFGCYAMRHTRSPDLNYVQVTHRLYGIDTEVGSQVFRYGSRRF